MAKQIKNKRCPLQNECGRKCENVGTEIECDYYRNNGIGDNAIPDQEELREQMERSKANKEYESEIAELMKEEDEAIAENKLVYIPIDELYAHPDNPRKDLGDLSELADSIKAKGVMQNLTVVKGHFEVSGLSREMRSGGYTVIIGHRRMGAAKIAGLKELPCVIVEMSHKDQIATMLLENMQRSDLTVFEQAQGFQMMMDFGESIDSISEKTGFSQTTVRRRLKMAELNQETLKNVSDRQLSLMDFDRLAEIKDIKVRNKVLSTIGTNNFESEMTRAIGAQKMAEQKEKWIAALEEKGMKPIPESELFAQKYESVVQRRFDLNEPTDIESDLEDGINYYYCFAYSCWIYIRKDKIVTEEDQAAALERERINAEKRAQREALEQASKRAFECRRKFVKETSNATAKKFIKDIISYAVRRQWEPNVYGGFDRDLYADMLDVKIPSGTVKYDIVQFETETAPEYAMLCYAYASWGDSSANDYYDYQCMHRENIHLNALYGLLEKLGYELSDEEIALRDGTSELFAKSEEDDEELEDEALWEDEDSENGDLDEVSEEKATDEEIISALKEKYGENDE